MRWPLAAVAAGVLIYVGARVLLLNNGAAFAFPREIEALALGLFGLTIVPAFGERNRVWLTAIAGLMLAVFVFLSLPTLAGVRLNLLAEALPMASGGDPANRPATCFCATRGSLHELFGPPDFTTAGKTDEAPSYVYVLDRGDLPHLALYELETGQGPFDRVRRVDRFEVPLSELRTRGLAPWGSP